MKISFSHIGLAKLCGWFGITRQAYYQNTWKAFEVTLEEDLVLQRVKEIRVRHGKIGTRKLYEMLDPFMTEHQIKMGRDALFNMLASHHMLVRRRKRRVNTTQSYHWLRKYPNLIRSFIPTAPNQLWVSDITYWKNQEKFVYISFITDAYSHKIVGYHVAETLETVESIQALTMALDGIKDIPRNTLSLIHHSDRGIQYCSSMYVKQLQDYGIKISMTESGDPLENAIAERINGIIKGEYLEDYEVNSIKQAKRLLSSVVELYNNERPHMSIGYKTPNHVHHANIPLKTEKRWKNYYPKNRNIVNPEQDEYQTVNTEQDYLTKL